MLSFVLANPQPGVSAVRYLCFFVCHRRAGSEIQLPMFQGSAASHTVLKLASLAPVQGRGSWHPDGLGSRHGMEETEGEM